MLDEQAKTSMSGRQKMMIAVYVVGFLVLVVGGFWVTCDANADVEAAADAYVEALRQKNYDAAYAMLAPDAQARVPRDKFETQMGTAELSRSSMHGWNQASSGSNGRGCVDGGVTIGDDTNSVTIWMLKAGERWTVHTIYFEQWDFTDEPWRCFSPP